MPSETARRRPVYNGRLELVLAGAPCTESGRRRGGRRDEGRRVDVHPKVVEEGGRCSCVRAPLNLNIHRHLSPKTDHSPLVPSIRHPLSKSIFNKPHRKPSEKVRRVRPRHALMFESGLTAQLPVDDTP